MILLVLALICLAGAAYMIGQLVTMPAQERQRFIKHVSEYGNERQRQILDVTEESLKTRVATPIG